MQIEIRKLQKRDNCQEFFSGDIEIDRFFIKFAGQNQFKHKIGCIGIFVDAKENAVAYYAKYAFEIAPTIVGELPTKPKQTLVYLSTKTIRKVFR